MTMDSSLRIPFIAACALHLFIGIFLWVSPSNSPSVLREEAINEAGRSLPIAREAQPKPEIIKAVSMDEKEVLDTMNQLKEQRARQKQQELMHQQELQQKVEQAKQERLKEQQRLAQLKKEAEQLAIEHKKQIAQEQARLKKLVEQKAQEAKRLENLKRKQQDLEKKQIFEAKHLEQIKQTKEKKDAEKAQLAKAKAAEEAARQKQEALERAAADAAQQAKLAGEINKYKALIINAISERWILPEKVNKQLSSQFRIRLAPDGAVLEVSLIRSSGDAILDRSAQTAIYKASPLPIPSDPATFNLFRDITLTVRPENVRG